MADYISRDIAVSELMPIYKSASFRNRNVFATARKCLEAIENIPTVDAVPIVRCGECKHRPTIPDDYDPITTDGFVLDFPDEECPCRCGDGWYSKYLGDDWFCANGERKEEGQDDGQRIVASL